MIFLVVGGGRWSPSDNEEDMTNNRKYRRTDGRVGPVSLPLSCTDSHLMLTLSSTMTIDDDALFSIKRP